MSNPVNTIDLNATLAVFLAAHNLKLQRKRDKTGGIVPDAGTNRRIGAVWGDLVDDFMLAWFQAGGGGPGGTVETTQTTDATPVVAKTVAVIANTIVRVKVTVWGRINGSNADAVLGEHTILVIDDAGTTTLWNLGPTLPADYSPSGGLTTATTAIALSGNDVEVTLTGEGATTIDWRIRTVVEEEFPV